MAVIPLSLTLLTGADLLPGGGTGLTAFAPHKSHTSQLQLTPYWGPTPHPHEHRIPPMSDVANRVVTS